MTTLYQYSNKPPLLPRFPNIHTVPRSRTTVQDIPKCYGCLQEIVTQQPLIVHGDQLQLWHTTCNNLFKTWNCTRLKAVELFGNKTDISKSFDCLAHWEYEITKIWTVMNEFEAALVTNYLILKERIKKPKATLTIECCSVLLEHTHELLRTAERMFGNEIRTQNPQIRACIEQLYDLDAALVHFLTEITHTEEVGFLSVNRLKLLLKESMYEISQLIRFVVSGLLVENHETIQYLLRQIHIRTYNLALKPRVLPPQCARTLEVDALSVQNIKWRHSLIELKRASLEVDTRSWPSEFLGEGEPQIYRKVSRRRPVSSLEFRKGTMVMEQPSTYVSELDYSQDDVIIPEPIKKPIRIPHSVFAVLPSVETVPLPPKKTVFKRISSLQTLSDESDSGISMNSVHSDVPTELNCSFSHKIEPKTRKHKWLKKTVIKLQQFRALFSSVTA
jgi:hypothetical protein